MKIIVDRVFIVCRIAITEASNKASQTRKKIMQTVFIFNKEAFEQARKQANQLDFYAAMPELARLIKIVNDKLVSI